MSSRGDQDSRTGLSSSDIESWEQGFYLDLTKRCLMFIAQEVSTQSDFGSFGSLVSVQLPEPVVEDAPAIYTWYDTVVAELSSVDSSLPIYMSSGSNLDKILYWSASKNKFSNCHQCPVLITVHDELSVVNADTATGLDAIPTPISVDYDKTNSRSKGQSVDYRGAVAVYLDGLTWPLPLPLPPRPTSDTFHHQQTIFRSSPLQLQIKKFQHVVSGSNYWTPKLERKDNLSSKFELQMGDGSAQIPKHALLTANEIQTKLRDADDRRSRLLSEAMKKHVTHFPNTEGKYEHWRYADGWHLGYIDARAFFTSRLEQQIPVKNACLESKIGADTIGALDIWILHRLKQKHRVDRDKATETKGEAERCEFAWEWEMGFRDGLKAFSKVVGIDPS